MKPIYNQPLQPKPLPMPTIPVNPGGQTPKEVRLQHALINGFMSSPIGKKTSPEFQRVLNQNYGPNAPTPTKPSIFGPVSSGALYKETVGAKLKNLNPKLVSIYQTELKKVENEINSKSNNNLAQFFGQKVSQIALDGMVKKGAISPVLAEQIKNATNADLGSFNIYKSNFLKKPGNCNIVTMPWMEKPWIKC